MACSLAPPHNGDGVPVQRRLGQSWLSKAAQRGHAEAKEALEEIAKMEAEMAAEEAADEAEEATGCDHQKTTTTTPFRRRVT